MTSSRKVYLSIVHHFIFTTTSLTHRENESIKTEMKEFMEVDHVRISVMMARCYSFCKRQPITLPLDTELVYQ